MSKSTPRIPHQHEAHGETREDHYHWMRERDSAPVLEYLQLENQKTREELTKAGHLETTLYKEMRSRIKEDDSSVPTFDAGYFYYGRYSIGQEYPIHCRKKGTLQAPEQVILDENELAVGHTYFDIGAIAISPNQRFLAYAMDSVGRRIYEIRVVDLETGKTLPDLIPAATTNLEWATDNKTLFFVRQDPETLRACRVFRYELGGSQPELIYEEKDTTYSVGIGSSKKPGWLFMAIDKRDSAEWRILDASQPRSEWQTFLPRENNHEYSLIDGGDRIFIHTNWNAQNFRLMEAPRNCRDKSQWKEIIPSNPKVYIESVDAFKDYLVISERENGLTQIRVKSRVGNGSDRLLSFPDPAYEVAAFGLPDYESSYIRFKYESLVQPPTVYDEDVLSEKRITQKVREVPGYNPALYESRRIWAKATDGALVPMSLLMKKGLELDGTHPALLYGYGSYGLTTDIYFRSSIFSLIDRGFVFALAHIRGGSEMGREWYEQGRLKNKMNTFTDFIACGEKLIADGFCGKKQLYMMGGSAGGLLVGAVMNMRPDLFNGVVAAVPFVDVLTTMLDETIPLTTGEYKEWGDPRVREDYMYMKQYSPYDNVAKKNYPNVLVTTGYHDSQVQYWEPAKWVARLRELKTDKNLLLFYTELEAGHSGASGRFEALRTLAKEYAFLLLVEGIKD